MLFTVALFGAAITPPTWLYATLLLTEAFAVVMPNADSIAPPVVDVGWLVDAEITPSVLVNVPKAVIAPPEVTPAAMLYPPVKLIPSAPALTTLARLKLPVAVILIPPVEPLVIVAVAVTVPPAILLRTFVAVPVIETPVAAVIGETIVTAD